MCSVCGLISFSESGPQRFMESISLGSGPFTIQLGQDETVTLECSGVSVLIDPSQTTVTWTERDSSLASLYLNANMHLESGPLSRLTLSGGQLSESGQSNALCPTPVGWIRNTYLYCFKVGTKLIYENVSECKWRRLPCSIFLPLHNHNVSKWLLKLKCSVFSNSGASFHLLHSRQQTRLNTGSLPKMFLLHAKNWHNTR